ncbi:Root cap [Senna tora]|uniref:Root cap n=1 Tax=Senna tora TaxID=362788 RepID=A0A835CHH5_9FABA|nr:Root cap [Senna tora]
MVILVVMVDVGEATPPGIAKNPSHATCKIKKYKHCYNLVHVCPKFCPDQCTVECASCKPICAAPDQSPPPSSPAPPTPDYNPPSPPTPSTPSAPPTPDYNPPPSPTPSTPSAPDQSSPPSSPAPPTPYYSPPPPTPSTPSTPDQNPPPSSPAPPTPDSSPSTPKTARCMDKHHPMCYNMEHVCPKACKGGCEVDCVTCKPICKCDKPGAVCQDPRFIGGDGITFYFHGKKDTNFCLLSDPNLHINAHFIGKTNQNMTRDFTWVQSISILFHHHQIFLGAEKTATWHDSIDRLALAFDGRRVPLPGSNGATWESDTTPRVLIRRAAEANYVVVEIEGSLSVTARVVPITEEDSRIHKYGITEEDCFAHLDLGFKFLSLSDEVNGVLGQTYRPDYVSKVDIRAKMPIMGGEREFKTTSLFAPDCLVSQFVGYNNINEGAMEGLKLPSMRCASGIGGQGVVCKR